MSKKDISGSSIVFLLHFLLWKCSLRWPSAMVSANRFVLEVSACSVVLTEPGSSGTESVRRLGRNSAASPWKRQPSCWALLDRLRQWTDEASPALFILRQSVWPMTPSRTLLCRNLIWWVIRRGFIDVLKIVLRPNRSGIPAPCHPPGDFQCTWARSSSWEVLSERCLI